MLFRNLVAIGLLALSVLPAYAAESAEFGPHEKALYDAVIRDDGPAVDAALAAGANPNLGSPQYGTTPLLVAIRTRHLALARHLVEKGADAWQAVEQDDGQMLPLDDAAKLGDIPLANFLLAHGRPPADAFTGGERRSNPSSPPSVAARCRCCNGCWHTGRSSCRIRMAFPPSAWRRAGSGRISWPGCCPERM